MWTLFWLAPAVYSKTPKRVVRAGRGLSSGRPASFRLVSSQASGLAVSRSPARRLPRSTFGEGVGMRLPGPLLLASALGVLSQPQPPSTALVVPRPCHGLALGPGLPRLRASADQHGRAPSQAMAALGSTQGRGWASQAASTPRAGPPSLRAER